MSPRWKFTGSQAVAALLCLATAAFVSYAFGHPGLWWKPVDPKSVDPARTAWWTFFMSRLLGLAAIAGAIFALRTKIGMLLPRWQTWIAPALFVTCLLLQYALPGCGGLLGRGWVADAAAFLGVSVMTAAILAAPGKTEAPQKPRQNYVLAAALVFLAIVFIATFDAHRRCEFRDQILQEAAKP